MILTEDGSEVDKLGEKAGIRQTPAWISIANTHAHRKINTTTTQRRESLRDNVDHSKHSVIMLSSTYSLAAICNANFD